MGNKAHLDINESMAELQKMHRKQRTFSGQKRVRCLPEIQSARFSTRQELADYSCVHKRPLERRINNYKSGGINVPLTLLLTEPVFET